MPTFEETAEAVARAFDRACEAAMREPEWQGVYVSPLWETESSAPPDRVRGWKRSVLRRIPGAGAEPWGHVFLVVTSSATSGAHVEGQDLGPGLFTTGGPASALKPLLWEGPPRVQLWVRPRSPLTDTDLRGFLGSVRKEFTPPGPLT